MQYTRISNEFQNHPSINYGVTAIDPQLTNGGPTVTMLPFLVRGRRFKYGSMSHVKGVGQRCSVPFIGVINVSGGSFGNRANIRELMLKSIN